MHKKGAFFVDFFYTQFAAKLLYLCPHYGKILLRDSIKKTPSPIGGHGT
jgi:hypothetical protein